jgi:hypothetical protein
MNKYYKISNAIQELKSNFCSKKKNQISLIKKKKVEYLIIHGVINWFIIIFNNKINIWLKCVLFLFLK